MKEPNSPVTRREMALILAPIIFYLGTTSESILGGLGSFVVAAIFVGYFAFTERDSTAAATDYQQFLDEREAKISQERESQK